MAGTKAKGLGKGLEALFGDVEIKTSGMAESAGEYGQRGAGLLLIDINEIKPNAAQPSRRFDEEKIDELANSINAHGLIQPVVVKKAEQGFELVAGERRWRAARKAGLKEIPGVVKELTEEQAMLLSVIENIQREDLNPIEEAEALEQMTARFGLTQEEVSKSVGKSRPYITNAIRLLKLPEEIRQMVLEGRLSNGHARALINVADGRRQRAIADKAASEGLSVRKVEALAGEEAPVGRGAAKKEAGKSLEIQDVEQELKELLGTKVTLSRDGKKGKIQIDYYSRDELERLIELIRTLKG